MHLCNFMYTLKSEGQGVNKEKKRKEKEATFYMRYFFF